MSAETVYQVVPFEAVYLKDPELYDIVAGWTDGEVNILDQIPQDVMENSINDNLVLLLNKANGSFGITSAASFALNFETTDPTEDFQGLQKSVIGKIITALNKFQEEDRPEEFYNGINAALEIIERIQKPEEDNES